VDRRNIAQINGQSKTMDAPPFVSATGRTMLPLRFIAENLGCEVKWESRIKAYHFPPERLSDRQQSRLLLPRQRWRVDFHSNMGADC
jgi:hypothetical protein